MNAMMPEIGTTIEARGTPCEAAKPIVGLEKCPKPAIRKISANSRRPNSTIGPDNEGARALGAECLESLAVVAMFFLLTRFGPDVGAEIFDGAQRVIVTLNKSHFFTYQALWSNLVTCGALLKLHRPAPLAAYSNCSPGRGRCISSGLSVKTGPYASVY